MKYDKSVNSRDRREYLEIYYKKLDYTIGIAFFNESGDIDGVISAVPTGHQGTSFLNYWGIQLMTFRR